MKQTNWFDDTLLPSLFEKWQNRDKQYSQIILTEAQAQQCSSRMEQKTSFSEFHGKSCVVGMEYSWRGRTVFLQKRGRYTFLSFGLTSEETAEAAQAEEDRQHDRKLERLRKLRAKDSPLLDRYTADAQRRLENAQDWLLDDDNDADDITYYTRQAKMAQEELDVCIG
ncbi:MAG: hypothetical protein LUH03_10065 [Oscillospiraceae bacterium]|nr:hypothetical protein [Oscillospiraceae bacterium]